MVLLVKETAVSEHDLQKQCVAKLRAHNYIVSCNDIFSGIQFIRDIKNKAIYKKHIQAMGGTVGFPDITLLKNGKTTFVEFKFDKGKLSPDQEVVHNRLRSMGYDVLIWRTLNECVEWILNDLKEHSKKQ